jgi:hypothetical protein
MTRPAFKVAREVADSEFERLCSSHRIETDMAELTDDEKKDWLELRGGIVKDIMRGSLVIAEDGAPTFSTTTGGAGAAITQFTFRPPTGATLLALETYAGGKNIANFMAAMADMARVDRSEFAKLDMREVNSLMRIAKLFLSDQ